MKTTRYLDDLIFSRQFRFQHLAVSGIDNETVARMFSPEILREEVCLFANTFGSGDDYFHRLHDRLFEAIQNKHPLPIVRFADGEYAFYRYTLGCNGLYKQAESIDAIKKAMPLHEETLQYLADCGILAPLIFPGNSQTPAERSFFRKEKRDSTAAAFLDFLRDSSILLTADNYIPFYIIYAYLSSPEFAAAANGKKICVLNSEFSRENCRNWFANQNSAPELCFVDIPREYVATRWPDIRASILDKIPDGTDLCIVGAGVGALLLCVEIARRLSVPALDAGHVLNMMNDRVDKSNGARLYTLRKTS